MPNHNTTTQSRIDGLQAALRAIVAECCGPARPYSDDSYLPAHFLEAALAALEGAPTDDAGNWQQYRLDASETAAQIIERERAAYANLLQSVHDERRSKASAPVADEPPGGTRWPVLRAMARNYTAGKHTWDALDANACEQAAEEIRHLRAALASTPVADTAAIIRDVCELDPADEGPDTISVSVTDLQRIIERHSALASVQRTACPTDVCQAGKADGVLCANDECDRANDVRSASAPAARKARPTDWQNALSITELPEVDEALATFCDDGTQDNAVGLVLVILDAAPQSSANDFAKLQSAYVAACDRIGELLAEKQASANAAGEALVWRVSWPGGRRPTDWRDFATNPPPSAEYLARAGYTLQVAYAAPQAARAKASPEDLP